MRDCYEVVGLLVVAVDDGDRGRDREVVVIVAVVTVVIALLPLSSYTYPQRIRYLLSLYIFS